MNKKYKEELTEKMHSELTVSEQIEIKHKAGCVWQRVPANATKKEVSAIAEIYGISYEDCIKYRAEWLSAIRNSEDRFAK